MTSEDIILRLKDIIQKSQSIIDELIQDSDKQKPKHKVEVALIGINKHFPECQEQYLDCRFTRDCANHRTAGDFRTEDGLTPDLSKDSNNNWMCSKCPEYNNGAILDDGSLLRSNY